MKHLLTKKGFTLIEAMVAVTMLSIVIASTMSIAQSSISANTYAQAQITANYLAGEAVEFIRNKRDYQFLNDPADWTGAIAPSCFSGNGCDVDTVNPTLNGDGFVTCSSGGCPALILNKNGINGYYHHSGTGVTSNFTRTVRIETVSAHEIAVRVTIAGDSGLFKRTPLIVVEHMFDWNNPTP